MRKVSLIRHALPDVPPGRKQCLGTTDVPLGVLGNLQAVLLGEYLKNTSFSQVFCSNLSRAVQTAAALSPDPVIVPQFREMDSGDWEGLYFDEIRKRWPEVYAKRGIDPNYPIPGAENMEHGQARFRTAVETILQSTDGDIAIVAHSTVIQSFISYVLGTAVQKCRQYKLSYTGITTICYENSQYTIEQLNEIPTVPLTDALCEKLLMAAHAPVEHCREICKRADTITRELALVGIPLNRAHVHFAALLHDIARTEKNHPAVGAGWLNALGYPEIAEMVAAHHDPDTDTVCEKNIVFLADKLPVEQRFAASLQKCTTLDALEAHNHRYQAAIVLKHTINSLCRKEIIP